jgi:hypothetical protein
MVIAASEYLIREFKQTHEKTVADTMVNLAEVTSEVIANQ